MNEVEWHPAVQDNRSVHLVLLLALAALLFFLGLGSLGLTDRDEGSNAEAAREMVETGDWVSPTLNYQPRFAKPAFIYWLMSAAYTTFGVSEFSARLPSAVAGVGLILLQYLVLARLRTPMVGLLSAVMLLLNLEIVAIGRMALTDSVLILCTTLSLYGFWLGFNGEARARHWIWLFYVGMGLGTLTKGPIGLAVPLLAVVPYLTLTKRWPQFWQKGVPLAGLAVCLAIALPWYATMLALHGSRYSQSAQADTIGRFAHTIGGHGGTLLFYVPILLFGFFPWSGLTSVALYQTWQEWRASRGSLQGRAGDLELFAALWLVAGFVFFSLSATRLPHYIGPLFPAAAILAACYWNRCLSEPAPPGLRAAIHLTMGLGFLLGLGFSSAPALYDRFIDVIGKEFPMASQASPGFGPVAVGLTLVLGCALIGVFGFSDDRRAGTFWAAGAMIAIVILLAIQVILPRFNAAFIAPPQELAYAAGVNLGPDDRLILYGPARPSLIFYAKRPVLVIRPGEEDQLHPLVSGTGRTLILLPSRLKPKLPPEAAGFVTILQSSGYSLLASDSILKLPANLPPPPVYDPAKDPHARYKQ